MNFIAIVSFDIDGRITKFAEYDTDADALAHVARVIRNFPNAFAAPNPGGGWWSWRVVAGILVSDPRPTRSSVVAPLSAEELYDMLVAKGVVADADRPRPKV